MLSTLTRAIRVLAQSVSRSAFGTKAAVSRRVSAAIEPLEERTLMSTYYISPSGNDSNNGTSINSAWKSIGKINSSNFKLGDNILFQGGQTYNGTIRFSPGDGGSDGGYVTVSSYNGRATISSGGANGAYVFDTSGIDFENLKFQGSPGGLNQYGIVFETTHSNYKRLNIKVNNCEVTGYNGAGILVMGDTDNSGFSNVVITNNSVHDNVQVGIETYDVTERAIDNVYVGSNQVYSNYGDGHSYVTGSGIQLGDVENALAEHNNSYLNGVKGGNGGVGIWAYESDSVVFQYNNSYDNHGYRGHDGDGFDFDADTSNSVMQYNFAANNDGTGFQLDQWRKNSLFYNDTVRYNVAENNGQRNNYGSIEAWGHVINSSFIGNQVYISPAKNGGSPSGMHVYNTTIAGMYVSNLTFSDNSIVATGGLRMMYVPSAETQGAKGLTFTGNTYDSLGQTANFVYASKTYYSLASLEGATGQEHGSAQTNAAVAFPAFATPAASAAGSVLSSTLTQSPSLAAIFGSTKLKDLFDQSVASTRAGKIAK